MRILRPPWRTALVWLLGAALAVAALSLVLDGGRPAIAAGDCQYGPYGPYGGTCQKVTPTLSTTPIPSETELGIFVYDAAALNGDNPTGTLVYRLFAPGDETCISPTFVTSVPVSGNRTYFSFEGGIWPAALDRRGTWRWTVSYSGDARNEPVTSGCAAEPVVVRTRTTFASIVVFNSFQPIGSQLGVSVFANGYRPTGTLVARLFRPDDPGCSGAPFLVESIPFDGLDSVGRSLFSTPVDTVGTWRWRLDYPGDVNNTPVHTACGVTATEVQKASPSLSLSTAQSTLPVGKDVSVSARLDNAFRPTGTINVRWYAPTDPGCAQPAHQDTYTVDGAGLYTSHFAPTSVGTWRMRIGYSGDPSNNDASLACVPVLDVTKASPALTPVAIPTTAAGGTLASWALARNGYQPTGRVLFRLFGPLDTGCAGLPAYVEEALLSGTTAETHTGFTLPKKSDGVWNWTAEYLGDDNNAPASTACGGAPVTVVAKTPSSNPSTAPPFDTSVYFNCVDDHVIAVPSGSRLVLRIGFAAKTERQIKQFLSGTETRLTVNGVEVAADRYWGKPSFEPANNPDAPWITRWVYDTGRTVTVEGQPFAVEFDELATKAGTDGFGTWNAGDVLISTGGPCLVVGSPV